MSPSQYSRRRLLVQALGAAGACNVRAQSPHTETRTMSFMVPQPPGNPTDGMARKMQPVLQTELRQPVIIENAPGAGGSIGVNKVLRYPSDAPALLIATQTETILSPLSMAGVRYRSEELRAIGLVTRTSYVLAGRPDLPASNLAQLIALARTPGAPPLSHGNIGTGSMIHLLGEQWARKTKVPLTQVAYKGVPPALQDLMSGQIDLSFLPLAGNTLSLIAAGKVRVYGITAANASPRLPQVAPLSQQDPALGGYVYGTWAAVFVPRATPEREVQRLHRALATALKDPELRDYLATGGSEPAEAASLAQLESFYKGEIQLYRELTRELGVKPE